MAHSFRSFGPGAWLALAASLLAGPAAADLSAFVAAVGFDEGANLNGSPGIGLRWGRSSGFIGGETSLMVARPEREVGETGEPATAIFYEGRLLVNIPVGQIKPFVGVGFGAITILPGDLEAKAPTGTSVNDLKTLNALSQTETNQAFSYGAGVRLALNERLDARLDLRQYQVFSVQGAVVREAAQQAGVEEWVPKEETVQYSELSAGVVFRF